MGREGGRERGDAPLPGHIEGDCISQLGAINCGCGLKSYDNITLLYAGEGNLQK